MTEHDSADEITRHGPPVDLKQAVLEQLGGPWGMVYTALPIVAFVTANAFVALPAAIGIAIAVALGITGWRLLRNEPVRPALSRLFGVVVAGGVAAWTGSAGGFFLLGIWASLVGAIVLLASVLARRPLTGVVWNAVHSGEHPWHEDRPALRGHDIATLAVAAVFASRFLVQRWLYDADATGWLAFAKIAMGMPLLALALVVVVWAFHRSTRRLTAPAGFAS